MIGLLITKSSIREERKELNIREKMADERFQVVIGAVDRSLCVLQQVKGELAGLGAATQTSQQTMSQAFGKCNGQATLSATVTAPLLRRCGY